MDHRNVMHHRDDARAVTSWLSDPADPRVVAAMTVKCSICKAPVGARCVWPIGPRLIHEIRVPNDVIDTQRGSL